MWWLDNATQHLHLCLFVQGLLLMVVLFLGIQLWTAVKRALVFKMLRSDWRAKLLCWEPIEVNQFIQGYFYYLSNRGINSLVGLVQCLKSEGSTEEVW